MTVSIDHETTLRLLELVGTRLVRVVGRRYPNPLSYDQIYLVAEGGRILLMNVRMHDVSDKLEVPCISARGIASIVDSAQCDDIRLADFRVDQVLVLRRAEWLDQPEHAIATVGNRPLEQHSGTPAEAPPWLPHALVDAGMVLVDYRGSQLVIQADAFPLVMQCHYFISTATIPRGDARTLETPV